MTPWILRQLNQNADLFSRPEALTRTGDTHVGADDVSPAALCSRAIALASFPALGGLETRGFCRCPSSRLGGQHGQHHEQGDESLHSEDDHGSSAGLIGLRATTHTESFSSLFSSTPDRRCRLRAVRPHGGCFGGSVRSGRSGWPAG